MNVLEADGNPHGRMDDAQQEGIPADVCARRIIRGLEKEKERFPGGRKRTADGLYQAVFTRA